MKFPKYTYGQSQILPAVDNTAVANVPIISGQENVNKILAQAKANIGTMRDADKPYATLNPTSKLFNAAKKLFENRVANLSGISYEVKPVIKELITGQKQPFRWDGKMTTYDTFLKGNRYGDYVRSASQAALNRYTNKPDNSGVFDVAQEYDKPTKINYDDNIPTYRLTYDEDMFQTAQDYNIPNKEIGKPVQIKDSADGGFVLNNYTMMNMYDKERDANYIQTYDIWNLDVPNPFLPKVFGKTIPVSKVFGQEYNIANRMYYDKATGKRLYMNDVGELIRE